MSILVQNYYYPIHSIIHSQPLTHTSEHDGKYNHFGERSSATLVEIIQQVVLDDWVSLADVGIYRQMVAGMFAQADNAISTSVSPRRIQSTTESDVTHIAKNQVAKQLVQAWLADDSGYDEEVWPLLQQTIEENRLSHRPRFHE